MRDDEAKRLLLDDIGASREAIRSFEVLADMIRFESRAQNLISRASLEHIWVRHILDSAQLVRFAPDAKIWMDIGTGAGFPGLVLAVLHPARFVLVESRRLRADFLHRASHALNISDRIEIVCSKLERVDSFECDAISARAFASLDHILNVASRFAVLGTRWILPKGRSAQSELERLECSWQGVFHVKPSLTDPEAGIITAERVSRRGVRLR